MFEKWFYPLVIIGMTVATLWMVRCAPSPKTTSAQDLKAYQDSLEVVRCREHGGKVVKELDGLRWWCE